MLAQTSEEAHALASGCVGARSHQPALGRGLHSTFEAKSRLQPHMALRMS